MQHYNNYIDLHSPAPNISILEIILLLLARNAVIVILSAAIAAIFVDLYGYRSKVGTRDFFSLTGQITEGIPTPRPPQLYFNSTASSGNGTYIYKPAGEVLGVSKSLRQCVQFE